MTAKFVGYLLMCLCLAAPAALAMDVPSTAGNDVVTIKNFAFAPVMLHVRNGTTVIWKNLDGEPHTVVSDSGVFRSGALDEGDSFQFTFDKPGTYEFFCSVHPHMRGTIVVD